jgi:hypothetical protein
VVFQTKEQTIPNLNRHPSIEAARTRPPFPVCARGESFMNLLLRWLARASVLCVLVGAVIFAGVLVETVGGEGSPLSLLQKLVEDEQRARHLETQGRLLEQRIARKVELSAGVAEGRVTLLAAAACLRDLDESATDFGWDHFRLTLPGQSDDERHCREVIEWVRGSAEMHAKYVGVVERLEEELAEHLRHGSLCLPRNPSRQRPDP